MYCVLRTPCGVDCRLFAELTRSNYECSKAYGPHTSTWLRTPVEDVKGSGADSPWNLTNARDMFGKYPFWKVIEIQVCNLRTFAN